MSLPHPAGMRVVGAIVYNPLLMPGECPEFMAYTIKGGQTLKAGSVLGVITATGKLLLSASAAGDGSQTPMAVLLEPVTTKDAAGADLDMVIEVAVSGMFNETALVFGAGHSIATTRESLRGANIYTRRPGYSG